jgi:hypothetical protein
MREKKNDVRAGVTRCYSGVTEVVQRCYRGGTEVIQCGKSGLTLVWPHLGEVLDVVEVFERHLPVWWVSIPLEDYQHHFLPLLALLSTTISITFSRY